MRSINRKLFLLLTVSFIIPFIAFGIISYVNYFSMISDQLERSNIESINGTINEMMNLLNDFDNAANELMKKKQMWEVLRDQRIDERSTEFIIAYENVIQALRNILIENNYINSVYLYMDGGSFYYANYSNQIDTSYNPRNEEWFLNASNGKTETLYLNVREDKQITANKKMVIPYVRSITANDFNSKDDVVVFNINLEMLKMKLNLYSQELGGLHIVDKNGTIIFSNIPDSLIKTIPPDDSLHNELTRIQEIRSEYVVNIYNSEDLGWRIVSVIERQAVSSTTNGYPSFILMFLFFVVGILIIITAIISNELSKPIKRLEAMTREIESMKPDQKYSVDITKSEGLLAEHFNSLYTSLGKLIDQLNISMDKRQEQEKRLLEAQINPHFIYNTLSSIRWQAVEDGNKKIEVITIAIINLFKSSIKVGRIFISIKEELAQIKDYITIQKFRRGINFHVDYDIDSSVLDYMTLNFVLQPIIENSIFHGISENDKEPLLSISVKHSGGDIIYIVKDNGRGMTSEDLGRLLIKKGNPDSFSKGMGISNVDERIKRYFGQDYGLKITSSYEIGTTVEIKIPAVTDKDVHNE